MFHCNDAISALLDLWPLKNSQELNATIDVVLTVSQLCLELKKSLITFLLSLFSLANAVIIESYLKLKTK